DEGEKSCPNEMPDVYGRVLGLYPYGAAVPLALPVGIKARIDLIALPRAYRLHHVRDSQTVQALAGQMPPASQGTGGGSENKEVLEASCSAAFSLDDSGETLLIGVPFRREAVLMASAELQVRADTREVFMNRAINADGSLG